MSSADEDGPFSLISQFRAFLQGNFKKMDRDMACPPCPPSRERSSTSGAASVHAHGKVTTNPFFNFLREFRGKNGSLTVVEAAVQGANVWNRMSAEERSPYVKLACGHPQRVTPCGMPSSKGSNGHRSRSRARSRSSRRGPTDRSASRAGRKRRRSQSSGGRSHSRGRRARRC